MHKKGDIIVFFMHLEQYFAKNLQKSKYFWKKLDFFIILGIIDIELALTSEEC